MSHVDPATRRRYKTMVERDDGWCDWIQPLAAGYRLKCCDCGVVHDMEFRTVGGRIQFRARQNDRATAAARRQRS